jgi:adenylate cyclase
MPGQRLAFGPFLLDAANGTLLRHGEPVAVGQRAVSLLEAFLRQPGEVLTKAELMDAGWPGTSVEESNLSVQIASLRRYLGRSSDGGEWIATIPRIGYRFVGALEPSKPAAITAMRSDRVKPSLAVLPFANIGKDPDDEIFADGLVADIITTLSKLSGLLVIARNSTFAYKGRSVDVREIARELGVRHVLEGSVRRGGNRIRVTVQLADAETGGQVWAERYDRDLADIFAVQDEITLRLATEMQVHLTGGERARLRYTTTTNVEAWDHWAKGKAAEAEWMRGRTGKEKLTVARGHFEKALALDPRSAELHAVLAFVHWLDARFGWWDDRPTALATGAGHVERALALDAGNGDAHVYSSLILLLDRRFDDALAMARKAIELAPGSAHVAHWASFVFAATGFAADAITEMERAMTVNPNYPPHYLGNLGNAYRLVGRVEDAIAILEELSATAPAVGGRDLVIAYQQSGRHAEARGAAARMLAAHPNFTVRGWLDTQFRSDTAQLEADAAALRAAGLPD